MEYTREQRIAMKTLVYDFINTNFPDCLDYKHSILSEFNNTPEYFNETFIKCIKTYLNNAYNSCLEVNLDLDDKRFLDELYLHMNIECTFASHNTFAVKYSIRLIQLLLMYYGYSFGINGNDDETTRKGIIDFKKANNIVNSEGKIDSDIDSYFWNGLIKKYKEVKSLCVML